MIASYCEKVTCDLEGPVVAKLLPSAIWPPDSREIAQDELSWGSLAEQNL